MKKSQNEQKYVRQPCIELMRNYEDLNCFRGYKYFQWICPQDLGYLDNYKAALAKKNGLKAGVLDMYILASDTKQSYIWIIEFKYGNGRLSDCQEEVKELTEGTPVKFLTIYNPQDFGDFIEAEVMRL